MGANLNDSAVDSIAELVSRGEGLHSIVIDILPKIAAGERVYLAHSTHVSKTDITDLVAKSLPHPVSYAGNVQLTDVNSFVDFTNRYSQENSVIFASKAAQTLVTVFDYHDARDVEVGFLDDQEDDEDDKVESEKPKEAEDQTTDAAEPFVPVSRLLDLARELETLEGPRPHWGRFRTQFSFPQSSAYKTWTKFNKHPMTQAEFANFIEENILDLADPHVRTSDETNPEYAIDKKLFAQADQLGLYLAGPNAMLQVARGMTLHVDEQVSNIVNTSTGEVQVVYVEEHKQGKSDLKVPSGFIIAMPVFEGGQWFKLLVRLRYRKNGANVAWSYDVFQLARSFETAFTDECALIAGKTDLPLFYGEAPPAG